MREYFGVDVQDTLTFEGFDGVVLATPHDEFTDLELEPVADALEPDPLLVDVMGAFDESTAAEAGLHYERL